MCKTCNDTGMVTHPTIDACPECAENTSGGEYNRVKNGKWPQDMKDELLSLHKKGVNNRDKAIYLDVTTSSIEKMLHRLLPRKAGKPEKKIVSKAERKVQLRKNESTKKPKSDARHEAKERKCLLCGNHFPSTHIGNRRCKPCDNLNSVKYSCVDDNVVAY